MIPVEENSWNFCQQCGPCFYKTYGNKLVPPLPVDIVRDCYFLFQYKAMKSEKESQTRVTWPESVNGKGWRRRWYMVEAHRKQPAKRSDCFVFRLGLWNRTTAPTRKPRAMQRPRLPTFSQPVPWCSRLPHTNITLPLLGRYHGASRLTLTDTTKWK